MHPSRYTSIRTGPDCVCHHSRLDHIGGEGNYEGPRADQKCQVPGCEGCARYVPLGPLNSLVLNQSDLQLDQDDHAREQRDLRRTHLRALLALGVAGGFAALSLLAESYVGVALAVICIVATFVALAVFVRLTLGAIWRLDPPHLEMAVAGLTPAIVVAYVSVAPFLPFPPWTGVCLAGALFVTCLILTAVGSHRDTVRFKRAARDLSDDLERALDAYRADESRGSS